MIFTILPLFLTNVLETGAAIVGLVEGVAEGTNTFLKLVSGWLSDRVGQRKFLTALGYGLSTVVKPFLLIAHVWGAVLAIRFVDRTGKGVRTSPRDALLADSSDAKTMGRSFGFHRAMDSLGAVVGLAGAALIIFLMMGEGKILDRASFRMLVLIGMIPGILGVLMVLLFVREVRVAKAARNKGEVTSPTSGISSQFKVLVPIMILFTLGNSSDAFLILRAQNLGLSILKILLVLVAFNVVYTAIATPAGMLSDKLGRRRLIIAGWMVYTLVYLGFALAGAAWQVLPLFLLYGLYYGSTEGVARAFVADLAAIGKRGTAYGIYHGALGASALLGSVIAGVLWDKLSPSAPFFLGAALAGASALLFLVFIPERTKGAMPGRP
ncbi:MAG: MFS transporter [Chloroflexi bacterium]|nr:MFS transporter [Chloroflexota bacterium]